MSSNIAIVLGLLYIVITKNHGNSAQEHEEDHHKCEHQKNDNSRNGSSEWVHDERVVSNPTQPNLVEEIIQLWWAQRGFIHNARQEKDELRRVKLVHIEKLDDLMDFIERAIEDEIEKQSVWDKPMSDHIEFMNRTAVDEMVTKWMEIEVFFSDYEIEGAHEICDRLRQELRNAQEDLHRRWAHIEKLSLDIEDQELKRDEKQENRSKT